MILESSPYTLISVHSSHLDSYCRDVQNERLGHQSDVVAGRIMSGSCGPLSGSEVKNGRDTVNDFRMIWSGGTASSKSNDRTKENMTAFILVVFPSVNMPQTRQ
jgi:hypothetical protein